MGSAAALDPGTTTARAGSAVLDACEITKSYRNGVWPRRRIVRVLHGADVVLQPGEVVGLVRENGSGPRSHAHLQVFAGPVAPTAIDGVPSRS